ncbi:MAG: Ig-like domain repeat protein [Pyrinomonadaceae bacterium]
MINLKTIILHAAVLFFTISSISAQVATGGSYSLEQTVIANGGGSSSSTGYSIDMTFAQTLAGGSMLGSPYDMKSGFWWGASIPTTTSVASSANPSVFGQNVTFTATVSPIPSGGTVTFVVDGNPLCAAVAVDGMGQSACSTSSLSIAGSPHSVVADYSGSSPYLASSGTLAGGQVVNKSPTTTTVASNNNPSVFGENVSFTATVVAAAPGAGTPSGTVTFNIDGNLYCVGTPLTAGVSDPCTLAGLPALPAGNRVVVAIYNGDANFLTSAGTLAGGQVVGQAATTIAITGDTPDPTIIGQAYTVSWLVSVTAPGAGTPTGTVTVSDGTDECSAPVGDGSCSLTSTTMGTKTLVAIYAGDANFAGSVSPGVSHVVNLQISGTVRNGTTLAPMAGVTVLLYQEPSSTPFDSAVTNASGVYAFQGQFTGSVGVQPSPIYPPYYEPSGRFYTLAGANISGADFLWYATLGDFPRKLSFPTQYIEPGAAGSMPVMLNSLGNEGLVSLSFTYDINPFAQAPTVVCGANAPGCMITLDNSVFGTVGVTIVPDGGVFTRPDGTPARGPEAAGPNEIARIDFQTVATGLPSTDFTIGNVPTPGIVLETGTNNLLLAHVLLPMRVVFVQGIEGDVSGRNAGNGVVDAADVVTVRRFVAGLESPVATHNEFQRVDTAPATTKGNGVIDATDVIQVRRYGAGLDAPQSAGGPGAALPPPPPAPAEQPEAATEDGRAMTLGTVNAVTGSRVTVPVEVVTDGDELAMSFTVRYDDTRLANPAVSLSDGPRNGVTLTVGTEQPGLIRILIDANTYFGKTAKDGTSLVDITFDVLRTSPSGDTEVEITDLVTSDADARELKTRATSGRVSIAGPNPFDPKGGKLTRRPVPPEEFDIIGEVTRRSSFIILRPRSERP